jgi:hypothetical protein
VLVFRFEPAPAKANPLTTINEEDSLKSDSESGTKNSCEDFKSRDDLDTVFTRTSIKSKLSMTYKREQSKISYNSTNPHSPDLKIGTNINQ